jgi:biopolymer transport protein ExbB
MSVRRLSAVVLVTLALLPGAARAWWNEEWSARKPLKIDTSAAGAAINEPIGDAPLLVRLHAGNFKFETAKEDGSDLRFVAGDDKTPLPFHVEKWDPLLGEALIWVGVPDLKPGIKTDLWLYSKNPKAVAAEDAKGTYDRSTALVYHFAEKGLPPRDVSVWANQATTIGGGADGQLIGRGLRLDGSAEATVTLPAGPSLAWAAGATATWSAWIRPVEAESRGVIFSRRDGVNALLIGVEGGKPFVQVESAEGVKREAAAAAIPAASWHHLAVTTGDSITLYLDAVPVAKLAVGLPALAGTSVIGADPRRAESPPPAAPAKAVKGAKPAPAVEAPLPGFKGELDELQIAKVERPLGFLKFALASQGTDPAKLLSAGPDEETAGMGSGYMAVILRSVTLDGWVVIGLLAVMAFVSFWVMATKAAYLSAVERANDVFSKGFHEQDGSLVELINHEQGGKSLGDPKVLASSSLHRLYLLGAAEILKRTRNGQDLSAHAVESIRAALDAGLVREGQRLNRQLVLLTIAISGGPFLGLLGTVVGVMITFAAIAAAGDVNVNAIAPGIAAALVATVAGLAVAIPSLFGYNWLLTRIKNVVALQQVFVDEFITNAVEAHYLHESAPTVGTLPRRVVTEKAG